jgi:tetratricopeptide (TPR) repeat protein
MLGAAPFVCLCAAMIHKKCRNRQFRMALSVAYVIALAMLPFLTLHRARVWQSPVTLWEDTVVKSPRLILFHHHLIEEYFRRGMYIQSVAACQETLQHWPDDQKSLEWAGTILTDHGDPIEGREFLKRLVQTHPENLDGVLELAENFQKTGEFDSAFIACESALKQNPTSERAQTCINTTKAGLSKQK